MFGAQDGVGKKVLLLQMLFILAVIAGFLQAIYFVLFVALEIVLVAGFCAVLFSLKGVGKDFPKYVSFFLGLLALLELFFFLPMLLPEGLKGFAALLLLFLLAFFFVFFRAAFCRNHCSATVLSSVGGECVVKTSFDLLSFVSSKTFVVKCKKNRKKGERVTLYFKRTFFGQKPEKIG